jgi:hypothetical protein
MDSDISFIVSSKVATWQTPDITCVICGRKRGPGLVDIDRGLCAEHGAMGKLAESEPLLLVEVRKAQRQARQILRQAKLSPPAKWTSRARWRWWVAYLALHGLERAPTILPWGE